MKIPKIFVLERDFDKKIEELLAKKILTCKPECGKNMLAFKISVVKYEEEFIIEYFIDAGSESAIEKELKITQPKLRKNGLNDLITLAESISSYHNKHTSIVASVRGKGRGKKGVCTVSLDQPLIADDVSKSLTTFYRDSMDRIKSVEVEYQ